MEENQIYMVSRILNTINARDKVQVDTCILLFFCHLFGVNSIRVINIVTVFYLHLLFITELTTTRVNLILLILCDLSPAMIWTGAYPHGFNCLLSY